jgi:hypothetical protein
VLAGYLGAAPRAGLGHRAIRRPGGGGDAHGTLFGGAMGRNIMPEMFSRGMEASVKEYVRLLLRAVGVDLRDAADNP